MFEFETQVPFDPVCETVDLTTTPVTVTSKEDSIDIPLLNESGSCTVSWETETLPVALMIMPGPMLDAFMITDLAEIPINVRLLLIVMFPG